VKREIFADAAPGKLVPTIDGALAFIPDALPPPHLDLGALARTLAEAREILGELRGISFQLNAPIGLIRPLQRREAVASSRIEGTTSSVGQLALFEAGIDLVDEAPDAREVHNYARALERGIARLEELPVSLRLMNELHAILLDGVRDNRGARIQAGQFRRDQVWIGGSTRIKDARYVPPPPQEVMPAFHALENYLQSRPLEPNLLVQLALIHYQFEAIHPYPDGNGRLGRLIIPLIMAEQKALPNPVLYLSGYFERRRDDYIDLMLAVSTEGRWEAWVEFFLKAVKEECLASIAKIREFHKRRTEFLQRVQKARSSVLLNNLVDLFFEKPVNLVPAVAQHLGISYNAAKNNLQRLAEEGIVRERERRGRKYWICDDVLQIMEAEPEANLQRYRNFSGISGVEAFEIGPDFIAVRFRNDKTYLYDYTSPGEQDVEQMKILALRGAGLGTYISQHVRERYAKKLS
jgi:Fic family protein